MLNIKTKSLNADYELETGHISKADWTALMSGFSDATIYQSWSYGAVRWDADRIEHAILRKRGEVVALAQLAVMKIPLFKCGVAYLPWGPLWKRNGSPDESLECLRQFSRGLVREYAKKRGLFLRILPSALDMEETPIRSVLEEEGFQWSTGNYNTLVLNLEPSLEVIRKGLAQKWRNQLNRAEKNGLKVIQSTDDSDYERFLSIYRQMMGRKKFHTDVSVDQFGVIQNDLPDDQKMQIFLCEYNGECVAGSVCSAIGDMGIYLLGASNQNGMKCKGSYLLQWSMVQWFKARGCAVYDLGGVDRKSNPGVYHFKSGISGIEACQIGIFEACTSVPSLLAVKFREKVLSKPR